MADAGLCSQHTGPFDGELISALPKSIKYICHNGAGYDNIDVTAATDAGELVISLVPDFIGRGLS